MTVLQLGKVNDLLFDRELINNFLEKATYNKYKITMADEGSLFLIVDHKIIDNALKEEVKKIDEKLKALGIEN